MCLSLTQLNVPSPASTEAPAKGRRNVAVPPVSRGVGARDVSSHQEDGMFCAASCHPHGTVFLLCVLLDPLPLMLSMFPSQG